MRQSQAEQARRLAIAPPVGDCWRRQFEADGLSHLIPVTEARVRLGLRIEKVPDTRELGASRLGGTPDLPAEVDWQERCLAQINLTEVAQVYPDSPLPKSGYLWFLLNEEDWIARVQYASADASLVAGEHTNESSSGIRFVLFEDIPQDNDTPDGYFDIQHYLGGHKLLGHGNWLPNPPREGDSQTLLLQLETDDDIFDWGGNVGYFLIEQLDLKRGRWEAATFELYSD